MGSPPVHGWVGKKIIDSRRQNLPQPDVSGGTVVRVRTFPGGPEPKLSTGKQYLLFLTESGVEGDMPNTYYITGAGAGAYEARDGSYLRMISDLPDGTPTVISEADLA